MNADESNFRRYEVQLKEIIERYPKPTTFECLNISNYTVRDNLRRAFKLIKSGKVPLHSFDSVTLVTVAREFTVGLTETGVYVGPRRSNNQHTENLDVLPESPSRAEVIGPITLDRPETLEALCLLKNLDLIKGIVNIRNLEDYATPEHLEMKWPNIAISQSGQIYQIL